MRSLVLLAAMPVLLVNAAWAAGPPTEAAVKASITKSFNEVYISEIWRINKVKLDFGPMKFGKESLKQVQYGKKAEPVWPVRVVVKVTTYKDDKESRVVIRGEKEDDVFFFYKDPFDEWKFKTGSL